MTSPHHHRSNGRIERFNRTILEGINKQGQKLHLTERLQNVLKIYNRVRHSSINMTPEEAREEENKIKVKQVQFGKSLKFIERRNKAERIIK